MKGETIRDATERWVEQFSRFQMGMISKLISCEPETWEEVTEPSEGDRVFVYRAMDDSDFRGENGWISRCRDDGTYEVELDSGETVKADKRGFYVEYETALPEWGWMWQFKDSMDDYWLEEQDGIRKMSECGFRVYESEEFGYFFGLNGGGYDFYEAHWIPLYKARGLQWHDTDLEKTA